ncbi:MAG: WS/DGAT domain-containing protein, partial [Parahaliea sp.]
ERVNAMRKAAGLTFNEAGIAMLSGALRRYLDELDQLPEQSLVANVPVALASSGDGGNAVLTMWVPMGTELEDPVERTAFVHEESTRAKQVLQQLVDSASVGQGIRLPSFMVRGMALSLSSAQMAKLNPPPGNVALSNVPSSATPIHVAGALVESVHGLSMLLQGQGMSTTFTSYAGQVVLGAICCAEAVPDPWRILDYMMDEVEVIQGALDRRVGNKAAGAGPKSRATRKKRVASSKTTTTATRSRKNA